MTYRTDGEVAWQAYLANLSYCVAIARQDAQERTENALGRDPSGLAHSDAQEQTGRSLDALNASARSVEQRQGTPLSGDPANADTTSKADDL